MFRLKLKEIREAQHLSIRELAARAKLGFAHLHQIETGKVSPSLVTLDRIAKALKVSVHDLISTGRAR